ncbi:hypothetical protein ERJ75_000133900 [Trypanosoma vivax]|uniref:Transmembrane protein n=1 Tax=Trypanosoma vivax (strain Y486) TaxID=1055687 RepID=G0TT30_TRYVY|nr:hypothetical protein TRVL_10350 [Trypanosoma vivax]KAH8619631.1 hypothetical protein ERJ75_000133900 [Trypanosoma vivax]CCC47111.1 conserved hypothetical protein [Trypanosoma vivax Y486]
MTHSEDGFGSSRDCVANMAAAGSHLREKAQNIQKNPAKEVGLSSGELKKRSKLAAAPHRYTGGDVDRSFEVKSSSRAQQIMSMGLIERQHDIKRDTVVRKMSFSRRMHVGVSLLGAGFLWWMGTEFLLPHYTAVQRRNAAMQLRYEMTQNKLKERTEGGAAIGSGT